MSSADDQLAQLLSQFGITPGAVAGTTAATPFTSGPEASSKIYKGTRQELDPTPTAKRLFGDINTSTNTTHPVEDTGTLEAKLGEFYNMTPQQRQESRRQLFVGGFYNSSVDAEDIAWGTPDESSYGAWTKAVARAALMYQAGQKVTVEDVLGQAAATGVGMNKDKSGSGSRVVVSDPASLALLANDVATKVLGRKASQDEQRAIIAAVQSHQASFSTGGVATQPDPTSTAESMLRDQNAAEAGAHDFAGTFDGFLKMLGGI